MAMLIYPYCCILHFLYFFPSITLYCCWSVYSLYICFYKRK